MWLALRPWSRLAGLAATFLLVGQSLVSLAAAAALLAAGGAAAERAFPNKRGAAGIERGRHAALLLPALLPLQTGGEGTAHGVTQPLSLMERNTGKVTHRAGLKGSRSASLSLPILSYLRRWFPAFLPFLSAVTSAV